MALFSKRRGPEQEKIDLAMMVQQLDKIYSNKSGDEYKMHGDITKSPVYDLIQRTVADLPLIKGVNKMEIQDLKKMFDMLHRPNFKKIVTDYISTKNPEYIMMTATYTVAYRVLIGELSMIYTSTEATDKGFVYHKPKYARKQNMSKFIRNFNLRIDTELTKNIRRTTKAVKTGNDFKLEYTELFEEAVLGSAQRAAGWIAGIISMIAPYFEEFGAWCKMLFPDVTALNPVSWFSSVLSRSYDHKVEKFRDAAALYQETKEAYDEYMKLPQFQRNKKVESKYLKNLDKYNIKMQNAQAKIMHYDQRAIQETIAEARREEEAERRSRPSTTTKPAPTTGDDEDNPPEQSKPEPSSSGKSSGRDDDPFDF